MVALVTVVVTTVETVWYVVVVVVLAGEAVKMKVQFGSAQSVVFVDIASVAGVSAVFVSVADAALDKSGDASGFAVGDTTVRLPF